MLSSETKIYLFYWSRAVKRTGANSWSLVPGCAITRYQKFSLAILVHRFEVKVPAAVVASTDASISTGWYGNCYFCAGPMVRFLVVFTMPWKFESSSAWIVECLASCFLHNNNKKAKQDSSLNLLERKFVCMLNLKKAHILDNTDVLAYDSWFLKYSLSIGRCNQHHGWWRVFAFADSHIQWHQEPPHCWIKLLSRHLGRNKLFPWYKTKIWSCIWIVPCLMFRVPGNQLTWDIVTPFFTRILWCVYSIFSR